NVGTKLRCQLEQVIAAEPGTPQRIARNESCRSIRRPTAHSPRDGNILLNGELHALAVTRRAGKQCGSAHGKVRAVGEKFAHVDAAGEFHREVRGVSSAHLLVERNRLVRGCYLVVAVVAQSTDPEKDIDLPWCSRVRY